MFNFNVRSRPTTTFEERYSAFFQWLEFRGVTIHPSIAAHDFQESKEGSGLIARDDLPKNTILFSIPRPSSSSSRSPILTVETSKLLSYLKSEERRMISKDWLALVLVLMWERVRPWSLSSSPSSDHWGPYFDTLPQDFDTLMFWNEKELEELTGSTILEKIGREEAEKDYERIIKPIIRARPDLFPVPEGSTWDDNYGLPIYHRMGSSILSRSFHVESTRDPHPSEPNDISMDTAPSLGESPNGPESMNPTEEQLSKDLEDDGDVEQVEEEEEEVEEEREPIENIAMLPLADLLNAKSGSANAKLFYEADALNMKTIKEINKGEQIYNTYGDPPNSDLLRRYGHVDDSNRFDLVEISMKTCLEVARSYPACLSSSEPLTIDELEQRVDWALEMGIDEIFEIPTTLERKANRASILPEELICTLKILTLSKEDFEDHKAKEKLPKPKLNDENVITFARRLIERRLTDYLTSIDEDTRLLEELRSSADDDHRACDRRRKAIVVRKSEKQILIDIQQLLSLKLEKLRQQDTLALDRVELSPTGSSKRRVRSHHEVDLQNGPNSKRSKSGFLIDS